MTDCNLLPTFNTWFDHFLSLGSESKKAVTSTITLQILGFSAGSRDAPRFKRFTFFSNDDTCSMRRCVASAFMKRFCCWRCTKDISITLTASWNLIFYTFAFSSITLYFCSVLLYWTNSKDYMPKLIVYFPNIVTNSILTLDSAIFFANSRTLTQRVCALAASLFSSMFSYPFSLKKSTVTWNFASGINPTSIRSSDTGYVAGSTFAIGSGNIECPMIHTKNVCNAWIYTWFNSISLHLNIHMLPSRDPAYHCHVCCGLRHLRRRNIEQVTEDYRSKMCTMWKHQVVWLCPPYHIYGYMWMLPADLSIALELSGYSGTRHWSL